MNTKKYISLELAKDITEVAKEKGVKLPESEFVWRYENAAIGQDKPVLEWFIVKNTGRIPVIPAYDTYELGEILPETIKQAAHIEGYIIRAEIKEFRSGKNWCSYSKDNVITDLFYKEAETEPEARGKMLLYLLKNDLLK